MKATEVSEKAASSQRSRAAGTTYRHTMFAVLRAYFPSIGLNQVQGALDEVGVDMEKRDLKRAIWTYRYYMMVAAAGITLACIAYLLFMLACIYVLIAAWILKLNTPAPSWVAFIIVLSVLFVMISFGIMATQLQVSARSHSTFHRNVSMATHRLTMCPCKRPHLMAGAKFAADAARRLHVALRGTRRAWALPPSLANRILEMTYPLINVDLTLQQTSGADNEVKISQAYAQFLHKAACLLIADRPDLIPALRREYAEHLPTETAQQEAIPDASARFLDPMRDQTRWSVVKDYWYPLASWLSMVVALTALVLSVVR